MLLAILPAAVVYLVTRLPSLLEPRWYTDEAGYASTAEAFLHGSRLYSGIWTNKPPLQILVVAIPVSIDQRSEVLLHLVSFLTGAAALASAAVIATRLLSPLRAGIALVGAAVVLGTPIVDAEILLPESVLIAPTTWAAAIVFLRVAGRRDGPVPGVRWAVLAGCLSAAAIALQQTCVIDAFALALLLLLSPRTTRRQLIAYAGTVAAITGAWLLTFVVLAGPGTMAYALAGFYVQYTQVVLPPTPGGVARHALILCTALALLVAGAVALRRTSHPTWAFATWAGSTLLVPASAQQQFPHFLAPSVIPVALLVASVPAVNPLAGTARLRAGAAAMAASVAAALTLSTTAGLDWILPTTLPGNTPHTLSWYYSGVSGILFAGRSQDDWGSQFDNRVAGDTAAADWIDQHGLRGHRAVVWSSDAWVYLLADLPVLMPTAPIYNDEILYGLGGPVADHVAALAPDLVVTAADSVNEYPEIQPLLQRRYRQAVQAGADTVWVRDDLTV